MPKDAAKLRKDFLEKGDSNKKDRLFKLAKKFVKDNRIGGPEVIWHSEAVDIIDIYQFVEQVCEIIGHDKTGKRY